jgi:hypothetical protein
MNIGKTTLKQQQKKGKGRSNTVFDTFICHTIGVNKMPQFFEDELNNHVSKTPRQKRLELNVYLHSSYSVKYRQNYTDSGVNTKGINTQTLITLRALSRVRRTNFIIILLCHTFATHSVLQHFVSSHQLHPRHKYIRWC